MCYAYFSWLFSKIPYYYLQFGFHALFIHIRERVKYEKKIDCFWFVSVFCLWLCIFSSLHLDVMWTFSYMRIHISLPARADTLFGTISTWTLCGRSSHVYLYLTKKKYYEWKKKNREKFLYIYPVKMEIKQYRRCTCDAVYFLVLTGWLDG